MLLRAGAWDIPAVVPSLQLFVDNLAQTFNADLAHAAEEGFLLFRDEVGSRRVLLVRRPAVRRGKDGGGGLG
jgi:hypothetical protein